MARAWTSGATYMLINDLESVGLCSTGAAGDLAGAQRSQTKNDALFACSSSHNIFGKGAEPGEAGGNGEEEDANRDPGGAKIDRQSDRVDRGWSSPRRSIGDHMIKYPEKKKGFFDREAGAASVELSYYSRRDSKDETLHLRLGAAHEHRAHMAFSDVSELDKAVITASPAVLTVNPHAVVLTEFASADIVALNAIHIDPVLAYKAPSHCFNDISMFKHDSHCSVSIDIGQGVLRAHAVGTVK
ncbi:hypothetical protein LTR17_026787 [Elasticomyces elasticus]|nr:hypothetical protein LTR17_026787 [Elasticomyces elasticus]